MRSCLFKKYSEIYFKLRVGTILKSHDRREEAFYRGTTGLEGMNKNKKNCKKFD
jgi:hypothetical protein